MGQQVKCRKCIYNYLAGSAILVSQHYAQDQDKIFKQYLATQRSRFLDQVIKIEAWSFVYSVIYVANLKFCTQSLMIMFACCLLFKLYEGCFESCMMKIFQQHKGYFFYLLYPLRLNKVVLVLYFYSVGPRLHAYAYLGLPKIHYLVVVFGFFPKGLAGL